MQNVVGWLKGSFFGGGGARQTNAASSSSRNNDSMHDGEEDLNDSNAMRNPNDDTIDYDRQIEEEEEDAGDRMEDTVEDLPTHAPPTQQSQRVRLSSHHQPQHRTPSASATPFSSFNAAASPAPLFQSPPGHSVAQRLSFGSAIGAFSPQPASPSPQQPQQHSFAFGTRASPQVPLTPVFGQGPATPFSGGAAHTSVDAQLRAAFLAFESGDRSTPAAVDLVVNAVRTNHADLDQAVQALARRTGDSRHIHGDGSFADESLVLVGELREKAGRYQNLLNFLRKPMAQGGKTALWQLISNTTQNNVLQTGELLECALALKVLLNAQPASLRRPGESGAQVSATDASSEVQVTARRSLALECMMSLVSARPDGPALMREGLSAQDVCFSETSRLPELLPALQAELAKQEERSVFAPSNSTVSQERLTKVLAGVEILHCILVASAGFLQQQGCVEAMAQKSPLKETEQPTVSWMLSSSPVREAVKSLVGTASQTILSLTATTKVTAQGKSLQTAVQELQQYQSSLFEHVFRAVRVYLMAFTSALAGIELLRQHQQDLSSLVQHSEQQLHDAFVIDRAGLLKVLQQTSRHMSECNHLVSAVFIVPKGGLPGVEEQSFPPFQPLYDLGQEFQDHSMLVALSLSEPSREIGDRRLIFFLAHYGWALMQALFETLLQSEQVPRLLQLAEVARKELPVYVRQALEKGEPGFYIRDSTGTSIQLDADGLVGQIPLYDLWLQSLLHPLPQYAWLHELHMGQYGDAAKILKTVARNEKASLAQKKTLLSLAKLSMLAGSSAGDVNPDGTLPSMVRGSSDASLGSTASSEDNLNPNELYSLNDELSLVMAQQFLPIQQQKMNDDQEEQDGGEEQSPAVLPPSELVQQLLLTGQEKSQPSVIRLHSILFAFDVLEKVFLPKNRSTSFERFSKENQDWMIQTWKSSIVGEEDTWQQIAMLKKRDASDAWLSALAQTQLAQVWIELMKPELRCYQHEEVYTQSFLQLLQSHPPILPIHLQSNEVRVILESVLQLVKSQQRT